MDVPRWMVRSAGALACAALGAVSAFAQSSPSPSTPVAAAPAAPPPIPARDVRLSHLMAAPVKGGDGAQIGKVSAVFIDLQARRIDSLRVEGQGRAYSCRVGPSGLQMGRGGLTAPTAQGDLGSFAGCAPAAGDPSADVRARTLLAARFHDGSGNDVGDIRDVVVDARTGTLHYYVGAFTPAWVEKGKVVALPLRPIDRKGGELVMHAELMELGRYPVFDEARLQDVWSPAFASGMDQYLYAKR